MTPTGGGLRPVTGSPAEVEVALRSWLEQPADEPLWVRTSGSTGEPKDVMLSARAVRASARATLTRLGGPGHWLLALPAHYIAGLQVIVRSIVAEYSPVVLANHADLATATARLPGSGRRYLAAVPTQLHRWLGDASAVSALASYDAVLLGGAPADATMLESARAEGIALTTTYGMSETCGGCVYDGLPLDGVGVALSVEGRIRVSGPVLFEGYAGQPQLTDEVLADGWLTTPDLGRIDDGRLVVVGRADDVVVSGGVNVALSAVERAVAALPGIDECAVVAMPDPEWGSVVTAVVVGSPERLPSLADTRDAVAATLPRAWAPRRLVVADELPYLESGKHDRVALLRLVMDSVD